MKKGKKKWIIIAAAAAVIVGGGLKIQGMMQPQEETVPQVITVSVERGDVAQQVDASGTIVSNQEKTYFSPVNGKIASMDFQLGDTVQAGTSMVMFDIKDLEESLKKAEMNSRSGEADYQNTLKKAQSSVEKQQEAKAQVQELERQVKQQETYLADMKKQLANSNIQSQVDASNAAQAAAAQAQAQAQAAQEAANAAYEEALLEYQRETLPEHEMELGILEFNYNQAAAEYNAADSSYQMAFAVWQADQSLENNAVVEQNLQVKNNAQIKMEQARNAYEEKKAAQPQMPSMDTSAYTSGSGAGDAGTPTVIRNTTNLEAAIEKASSKLAEMQSDLASKKAIAEADSAALTQEEKEKLDIANQLSKMDVEAARDMVEEGKKGIRADFTGVVSKTAASDGAAVTQGMELLTLASTEDVSVDVNISKYDFDKVKEGQKADITMGDFQYEGTVSKISRIATKNEKGSPIIGGTVKIDNPDENIFIGVDAKVKIHASQAKDVLVIPAQVVNIGKDGSFCYVLEDGIITRRDIETGISSVDMVEVKSGLEEKDQVILDLGGLMEGMQAQAAESSKDGEGA